MSKGNLDVCKQLKAAKPRLPSARTMLLVMLPAAACIFYIWGVLSIHQDRAAGWGIEGMGAIPVALTHLIYGAPVGTLDYSLFMAFANRGHTTVQDVMASAVAGSIAPGELVQYALEGNGLGPGLFATFAMQLFGISISSLVIFYLGFVGLSAALFLLRFHDRRGFVILVYFVGLTLLILTPLSMSERGVDATAIGGVRYFVVATFIPAFHLFFELIDGPEEPIGPLRSALLFMQSILLVAAILERSSCSYLVCIPLAVFIWRIYQYWGDRKKMLATARKGALIAGAFGCWILVVLTFFPAYVQSGRTLSVFWHRAFISFTLHPEWPFGDLRQVYDGCKWAIPEGFASPNGDRVGQCVWFAQKENMNQGGAVRGIYGGDYEKVMRAAFFGVVTKYPRQALELFSIYKTRVLIKLIDDAWNFLFNIQWGSLSTLTLIVFGQLALLVLYLLLMGLPWPRLIPGTMVVVPVAFLLSLLPRYVAWSSWETGADLILLLYCCLIVVPLLLAQLVLGCLLKPAPAPSACCP